MTLRRDQTVSNALNDARGYSQLKGMIFNNLTGEWRENGSRSHAGRSDPMNIMKGWNEAETVQ